MSAKNKLITLDQVVRDIYSAAQNNSKGNKVLEQKILRAFADSWERGKFGLNSKVSVP